MHSTVAPVDMNTLPCDHSTREENKENSCRCLPDLNEPFFYFKMSPWDEEGFLIRDRISGIPRSSSWVLKEQSWWCCVLTSEESLAGEKKKKRKPKRWGRKSVKQNSKKTRKGSRGTRKKGHRKREKVAEMQEKRRQRELERNERRCKNQLGVEIKGRTVSMTMDPRMPRVTTMNVQSLLLFSWWDSLM